MLYATIEVGINYNGNRQGSGEFSWVCVVCGSQPINNQFCGWTSLSDFYYDCKTPFSITIRNLKTKKGLLLTGPGSYMTHLGPHSEVKLREIEREEE